MHDMSWSKGKRRDHFGGLYNYQQIDRAFGPYGQAIEQLGRSVSAGLPNLATGDLGSIRLSNQFQAWVR
jgi:hypothetical protein